MSVTCPPGARAGDHLRVMHEAAYKVTIPAGVRPGQVFHANLPARSAAAVRHCADAGPTESLPSSQPLPDPSTLEAADTGGDGASPPSLPASPPGSAPGRSRSVVHDSSQRLDRNADHGESDETRGADGGPLLSWLLQTWRGDTDSTVQAASARGGTHAPLENMPEHVEDGGQRELRA